MSQLEAEETLSAGDVSSTAAEADGEVTMPLEVKEAAAEGSTPSSAAQPGEGAAERRERAAAKDGAR